MNSAILSEQSVHFPPNFKLHYLYRDAGNYKCYGSVVFTNIHHLSINYFVVLSKLIFIDSIYFDPLILGIDALCFDEYDPELDHDWHELEKVSLTHDPSTIDMDVSDFMSNAMKVRKYENRISIEMEYIY